MYPHPNIPTQEQALKFFLVCVDLSNLLLTIELVRLDARTNQIYILASKDIEILIYPNGYVRIL
ncbi:hypothetical protein H6G54_08590 [Anabaena cylindrica FACHB-243]|nr:hypothetical protein [Anabaena cylindrica FACHB-243]MBY5282607.1 hypothetical protein [Anabaena sp. CCAP 1446/1C]MBY5310503.1 hypothetical protein [Anabaena sp. CCAP 1446/1C]